MGTERQEKKQGMVFPFFGRIEEVGRGEICSCSEWIWWGYNIF